MCVLVFRGGDELDVLVPVSPGVCPLSLLQGRLPPDLVQGKEE